MSNLRQLNQDRKAMGHLVSGLEHEAHEFVDFLFVVDLHMVGLSPPD